MRNCSVADSLFSPVFHLLFISFAVIAEVPICSENSFPILINAYFIFRLWFRNPYFAYCLVMHILFVLPQSDKVRSEILIVEFHIHKHQTKMVTILQLKHFFSLF